VTWDKGHIGSQTGTISEEPAVSATKKSTKKYVHMLHT